MKRIFTAVLAVVSMLAAANSAFATVDVRDVTNVAGDKFDAYFNNQGVAPPSGVFQSKQENGAFAHPVITTTFKGLANSSVVLPRYILVTYFDEFTGPGTGTLVNTFVSLVDPGNSVNVSVRSYIAGVVTTSVVTTPGAESSNYFVSGTPYVIGNQLLIEITGRTEFTIVGTAQIVPEPATLTLWGSFGAMALVGFFVKRRRAAAKA